MIGDHLMDTSPACARMVWGGEGCRLQIDSLDQRCSSFSPTTTNVCALKMAFRKTVKKILSKLQHGKRDDKSPGSPKDKQAHSRPSTASTETVRPPGANVYQHPKIPPTKPPFLREESEFPQKIDQDYRPSNVLASGSAPVDVIGRDTLRRERYYEEDNDLYEPPRRSNRPQPLLDRDELSRSVDEASAKAFQPLMHHEEDAFPESILEPGVLAARTMSNLTVDTQASSDYDQHCLFPLQFRLAEIDNL
jgi:hypothetical protein